MSVYVFSKWERVTKGNRSYTASINRSFMFPHLNMSYALWGATYHKF